ncbi:MAG: Na/Pi cotransporter family protein [Spirochaetaceae bacterium]|nr:Na/Pi cotransporter family protein [Spirochaetaceae bacterium]
MSMFYDVLSLIIGAGVFLVGIVMFSESLKKNATQKTRKMFEAISGNRFSGYGVGAVATSIIQSSTAVGVMAVGLVNAGMINLFQGISIVLGAWVGTSSTVYLVALSTFNIRFVFMALIFVGTLIKLIKKEGKILNVADFLIGFGIVFVGLNLMSNVFRDSPEIREFFIDLFLRIDAPLLLVLIGMIFAIIIQSSTVTVAICYTLIAEGLMPFGSAIFIAMGAHAGTPSTAVLAALAANTEGKRMAIANLLFCLIGVTIFTALLWTARPVFLPAYMNLVPETWQLPFFQTGYNLILGLVCLPFINPMIRLVNRLIKGKNEDKAVEEKPFEVTFLQDRLIGQNVDIALEMAKKEILIGADLVKDMLGKVDMALKNKDIKLINEIRATDSKVDILHRAVILYLAKVAAKELGEGEAKRSMNYLYIQKELESIGDIIDKNLMPLAEKMITHDLSFPKQGSDELAELHHKVMDNVDRMIKAFTEENIELTEELLNVYSDIDEREYQISHIERLTKGCKVSINTTTIHLDIVNYYSIVNRHLVYIAERILWLPSEEVSS